MGVVRLTNRRALAACLLLTLISTALSGGSAWASPPLQEPSPTPAAQAVIAVDRAVVFAAPERSAPPLTYLFERERVPVLGQSADGRFVQVFVDGTVEGWVLRAQVEIEGGDGAVPVIGAASPTAARQAATPTPTPQVTRTPRASATATTAPSPAPSAIALSPTAAAPIDEVDLPSVLPGTAPPLAITLPDDWQALDLLVPLRTFDGVHHSVPLSIYVGPLPGGATGYVYLYWGFPYTVEVTGAFNLWADGVQILRGSLVGDSCNLGLYEQQAFEIGDRQGVGAYYQASECGDETDTAGWFTALRVGRGHFAFYTAVEPWSSLAEHEDALQAILDSVEFLPEEE